MTSLPLTPWVHVYYELPGIGTPRSRFNLGLVMDQSPVISTNERVVIFSSLTEMIDAGFTENDPAYQAATKYFSASSRPEKIAIGRWSSGETALAALQACRLANSEWYIAYVPEADDDDHKAIAAYVEALSAPTTQYFLQTDDTDVSSKTPGNLFEFLHGKKYLRTKGCFSDQDHLMAALMGYAMGAVTDLENSAFTIMYKPLIGITPDSWTTQQIANIESYNGNVYIQRGGQYNSIEWGTMFSGAYFDEVLYLDKLINDLQLEAIRQQYNQSKIPQTDSGMSTLESALAGICERYRRIGFIAPGVWTGPNTLLLKTNDPLPLGYMVMSQPIASQAQQDREARKAPPTLIPIKLAGSIQSVTIGVPVNR